jgi:hypothetical protein
VKRRYTSERQTWSLNSGWRDKSAATEEAVFKLMVQEEKESAQEEIGNGFPGLRRCKASLSKDLEVSQKPPEGRVAEAQ